jgi:hypothetical protein
MSKIPVYSIDTGVPVPETYGSFPLAQLKVGESILFPLEKRRSVATLASKLKKDEGKVYTIKKMDDNNARVWRVE